MHFGTLETTTGQTSLACRRITSGTAGHARRRAAGGARYLRLSVRAQRVKAAMGMIEIDRVAMGGMVGMWVERNRRICSNMF